MSIKESFECVVIGSDTQVGLAVLRYLAEREIKSTGIVIHQIEQLPAALELIKKNSAGYVIHCLGEDRRSVAMPFPLSDFLNVTQQITQVCVETHKQLIHLSSSTVFSGQLSHGYTETDEADATSEIGQILLSAENAVQTMDSTAIVLRTGWLFSDSTDNFLTQLVNAALSTESLVFSGKLMGSPTDAHSVARVIIAMIEQLDCGTQSPSLAGVFHYADSDGCSMHTFAKSVVTTLKSLSDVTVESITQGSGVTVEDESVNAERYDLTCKHILSTFGIKQRPWRLGIRDVLKRRFESATSLSFK